MPWTASEAKSHSAKADTPPKQKKWAKIANGVLKQGGDDAEGKAIRIANAAMDRAFWSHDQFKEYIWADSIRSLMKPQFIVSVKDKASEALSTITIVAENEAAVRTAVHDRNPNNAVQAILVSDYRYPFEEATCDKDWTAEQRQAAAEQGQAMPGGGFPISSKADVGRAIQAIGRAKDRAAAIAHIKARAKALGASALIPKNWGDRAVGDNVTSRQVCPDCGGPGCDNCDNQGWIDPDDDSEDDEDEDQDQDQDDWVDNVISRQVCPVCGGPGCDNCDNQGWIDPDDDDDDGDDDGDDEDEDAIRYPNDAIDDASIVQILGDVASPVEHLFMADTIAMDDDAKVVFKRDGYMTASPRVARTGIQIYFGDECDRPDMRQVRVYRPAEEVFRTDALHSFAHRPMTIDHPPVRVTANNWRQYAVGQTSDEILRDKDAIRVPLVLMDQAAVNAYKAGKQQLSVGYTCDLDWTPGTTPDGESYDAVQRNIRANHIAIVTAARGGPQLKIGDDDRYGDLSMNDMTMKAMLVDGIEVKMPDTAAAVVKRYLDRSVENLRAADAKIKELRDAAKKKEQEDQEDDDEADAENKKKDDALKAKDAEIVTLKQQLKDKDAEIVKARPTADALDAMVHERVVVTDKARKILGDSFKPTNKTVADIRKEVVAAKLGEACKPWDENQIKASFDTLTATDQDGSFNDGVQNFRRIGVSQRAFVNDAAKEKAYEEHEKYLQDAWKGAAAARQ